ncbi:MAG: pirin-like C-terminal cupin domain-containing protein, partial [Gammaproteobacteria bacterium]|nr:pirin-like C-terminal cupin domain-containing protein [Gammaproteobacteria bacterium]
GELELGDQIIKGAVNGLTTDPVYLDVHMDANLEITVPIKDGHTALVYVYEGDINIADTERALHKTELAILGKDGDVFVRSNTASRFLLLAGKPIGEPIAQYGPFVMNSPQEIEQAIQDYRDGVLTQ